MCFLHYRNLWKSLVEPSSKLGMLGSQEHLKTYYNKIEMAQRVKCLQSNRLAPTFLLCTLYVVLIPSVGAIMCNHCVGDPLQNLTCDDKSNIIDCETDPEFGRYISNCYTLKLHIAFGKDKFIIREKNCSMADEKNCHLVENMTCDKYNKEIIQHGGELLSCNMQCCSGDYCNGRRVLNFKALALSKSNRVSYGFAMWIMTLAATIYGLCPPLYHAVRFTWKL